jgi:hypothetical protein
MIMVRTVKVHSPGCAVWTGRLSDEHSASSYGIPVLLNEQGESLGTADLPPGTRLEVLGSNRKRPAGVAFAEQFGLPVVG